jgi:hypothetical protein
VYLAIFALIPALWNKYKKQKEAVDAGSALAEVGKLPAAKQNLLDVCYSETRAPESIRSLATLLLKQIAGEDCQLVLNFATQITKLGTSSQREAVYALTDAIVNVNQKMCVVQEVTNIAYAAVTDMEIQTSPIVRRLLRTLVKNGVVAQNAAKLTGGKSFSLFPEMTV